MYVIFLNLEKKERDNIFLTQSCEDAKAQREVKINNLCESRVEK